ncbi:MAG: DUF2207 domain-containing protein [Anaerolineae bacterium]|nr:DUF2207 domain-containing protein [Anaerolineae bacterium]
MMRVRLGLLLTLTAVLLGLASAVTAQSRSVFWRQWNVHIDNIDTANNRFDVSEQYEIDFSGTFTFGSAVVPLNNIEDIRRVQVLEAGQPLRESCSGTPGTFCAELGADALSVTYYFSQPIRDSAQQFEIRYTVIGALRVYEGGDQLYWIAVPSDRYGFSVGDSTVTVQMPPGFAPREGLDPVETYGVPARVSVSGTTITAVAEQAITGSESFEIRVQYPHSPSARVALWQAAFDRQQTVGPLLTLGAIALSILLLLGGSFGLYALWYTRGRDPRVGPVPQYLTEPPSDLRPAEVGTLLDEIADVRDVISILIDLAQRGYLVLEENQREGILGFGRTSEFTFKRTDKVADDLKLFEKRMLNSLFATRPERTLESLRNSFYAVIPYLQQDLYAQVVKDELFRSNPNTTRWTWIGLSILLLVIAGIGLFVMYELSPAITGALFCIPAALGVVGLLGIAFGQAMPAKTRKGAEEAAKWRAFLEYLRNLEKYADVQEAGAQFAAYLPYAVAFGIERSWIRRFSQLTNVPVPRWYYPTYMGGRWGGGYTAGTPLPGWGGAQRLPGDLARADADFSLGDLSGQMSAGLNNISNSLTTLLSSASSVMTSQPQQTSGSSGRWSSGGRSWSGGGSSRGGGSGGGSRGFG